MTYGTLEERKQARQTTVKRYNDSEKAKATRKRYYDRKRTKTLLEQIGDMNK